MKVVVSLVAVLLLASVAHSQSGRRPKDLKVQVPLPAQEETGADKPPKTIAAEVRATSITAERNQDYRCSDDGTLERILETAEGAAGNGTTEPNERILTSKETDSSVEITAKPKPSYTKEARRNGIQGFVVLRLLLSGNGKVSRVRVIRGLPAGLTENAMRAGCKMKFRPALKDGAPVSQWVIAEYAFRLSDSSIFRP
ncbi:MAG: TonB family protein [Pyrinomonadaceae bacterium]|nr:TonB family protein [Pyrinomonadaceae bacterium]